jgi:hypothetical protein
MFTICKTKLFGFYVMESLQGNQATNLDGTLSYECTWNAREKACGAAVGMARARILHGILLRSAYVKLVQGHRANF